MSTTTPLFTISFDKLFFCRDIKNSTIINCLYRSRCTVSLDAYVSDGEFQTVSFRSEQSWVQGSWQGRQSDCRKYCTEDHKGLIIFLITVCNEMASYCHDQRFVVLRFSCSKLLCWTIWCRWQSRQHGVPSIYHLYWFVYFLKYTWNELGSCTIC